MGKSLNSYYDLGCEDLTDANTLFAAGKISGKYNGCCVHCAQACEKLLKGFLLEHASVVSERSLKTHNLRTLIKDIGDEVVCNLDTKLYKWVGDMYFDCKYPGDNFIAASQEDAISALEATATLKEWVDENSSPKIVIKPNLQRLLDLDSFN